MRISSLLPATIIIGVLLLSAPDTPAYEITEDSVKHHVYVLAADSMEGRLVGEPGEWKAARYIRKIMQSTGLRPAGSDGYLQSFDFIKEIAYGDTVRLTINGTEMIVDEDFRPLPRSGSGAFSFDEVVFIDYGIVVDSAEGSYNDYADVDVANKAVVIKRLAPEAGDNPHIDFKKYSSLTNKINTAIAHKAGAVLFITPAFHDDTLRVDYQVHVAPKDIPIAFLKRGALTKLGLDIERPDISSVAGNFELVPVRDTGYNVVGRLDGDTDTAIVVGAHYDHLGWGSFKSLYRGSEPKIHNGADDNASGVSAVLELARYYAATRDRRHSLIFCAFSGEEAGLVGSSNYVNSGLIDTNKVHLMINMDMIGHLHDKDTTVAVFGIGSAEEFEPYFDSLQWAELKTTHREPGTGPSDQTAFYNRNIPVLYFFTGAHEYYHKPSDDPETVDCAGIVKVTDFIRHTLNHFDDHTGGLTYQRTKGKPGGRQSPHYSVTLGIMPDYVAEVTGLRVDGVMPDRPGERAGLLEGDVIVRMGEVTVGDIYDYMNGLSKFRKGDTTGIDVVRNADTLTLTVVFE